MKEEQRPPEVTKIVFPKHPLPEVATLKQNPQRVEDLYFASNDRKRELRERIYEAMARIITEDNSDALIYETEAIMARLLPWYVPVKVASRIADALVPEWLLQTMGIHILRMSPEQLEKIRKSLTEAA